MKTLLLIYAITIMVSFCQDAEQLIAEEFRTKLGKVVNETKWPGEVARIVAVTYDYEQEASEDVVVEGRLHKGVFLTSKDLTEEQTKKLYSAITGAHVHQKAARCFEPHHGFIFYDAGGKILGNLTICFGCNSYHHAPEGEVSKVFDLKELKNLMVDLKMPILNEPNDYKNLFNEHKGQQGELTTPENP